MNKKKVFFKPNAKKTQSNAKALTHFNTVLIYQPAFNAHCLIGEAEEEEEEENETLKFFFCVRVDTTAGIRKKNFGFVLFLFFVSFA